MNWFATLFSGNSSRKGQALSSTHEAFSIPTSSPIFSSHTDAFNTDGPEPYSATSASYTYPPQSPYGYVPTSGGLSSARPTSLLPTHHDPMHSHLSHTARYPSPATTWNRLRTWLAREYPELGDTLNYGILPQDLAQVETQFGFALPPVVRDSYLAVDGQEAESSAGCSEGLFFGLTLLPLEEVLEEWKFWREVDEDPTTGGNLQLREAMESFPPGYIRCEYSQRGWIPLIKDKAGNYIGVDLNPGDKGAVGQVIVFGRDFDTKVVLFNGDGPAGWAKWLASFVDELESGEGFELGSGNESGEGSEDDLGYESYFYDGTGRGQGDGGGDTASGLRMTGEYRGWNVLEAWADRSVRRWYDSGVVVEVPPPAEPEKPKIPEITLNTDAAAEVAIPVLAESPTTATPSPSRARKPPTVSVTKPPAPLPVELPTPRDIESTFSPPESIHSSFDDDLESGRRPASARQMSGEMEAMVSRQSLQNDENSLDTIDPNESTSSPLVSLATPPLPSDPVAPGPPEDILIDTATSTVSEVADDDDAEEPKTTIRLVGGGGEAGLVNDEQPQVEELVSTSEPEIDTTVTSDATAPVGKGHKKTKSGLAGLKKSLGGLRKKDSVSSVKEVIADSKP